MSSERRIDVWKKGIVVDGYNEDKFRQDSCGAWMQFDKYGDRTSTSGWEIDHKVPESKGGSDNISNLRPSQWKNNVSKQDNKSNCSVTSNGEENVEL